MARKRKGDNGDDYTQLRDGIGETGKMIIGALAGVLSAVLVFFLGFAGTIATQEYVKDQIKAKAMPRDQVQDKITEMINEARRTIPYPYEKDKALIFEMIRQNASQIKGMVDRFAGAESMIRTLYEDRFKNPGKR